MIADAASAAALHLTGSSAGTFTGMYLVSAHHCYGVLNNADYGDPTASKYAECF